MNKEENFIYGKAGTETDIYARIELFMEKQTFIHDLYAQCVVSQFGPKVFFSIKKSPKMLADGIWGIAIPGPHRTPLGFKFVRVENGQRMYRPDRGTTLGRKIAKEWKLLPKLPIETMHDILHPNTGNPAEVFSLALQAKTGLALFKIPAGKFYLPDDIDIISHTEYVELLNSEN